MVDWYRLIHSFSICLFIQAVCGPEKTPKNMAYQIKPERLKQIEESPSGWVPPATGKGNNSEQ